MKTENIPIKWLEKQVEFHLGSEKSEVDGTTEQKEHRDMAWAFKLVLDRSEEDFEDMDAGFTDIQRQEAIRTLNSIIDDVKSGISTLQVTSQYLYPEVRFQDDVPGRILIGNWDIRPRFPDKQEDSL